MISRLRRLRGWWRVSSRERLVLLESDAYGRYAMRGACYKPLLTGLVCIFRAPASADSRFRTDGFRLAINRRKV